MTEEPCQIEQRGYEAGCNPYKGGWNQKFSFPPISYSNQSELKQAFKKRLRAELNNRFVYFYQVTLIITLYLNHEKVLETPEYADLDNYAKSICDVLKGKGGIIIDDCQIQRIDISWIDVPGEPYFELEMRSSPDDFMPADLKLYEMPDKLYYPVSQQAWDNGNIVKTDALNKYLELKMLAIQTLASKNLRHQARLDGAPQFRAFQYSQHYGALKWAFHLTRVADSGYQIVSLTDWIAEFDEWSKSDENAEKIKIIETMLTNYEILFKTMTPKYSNVSSDTSQ